jgi:serine phosphatase RsbU (regulator of sigma subunit)
MLRKFPLLLLLFVFCFKNKAQFLDKKIYLVDSIEKNESNKNDFEFIEKGLKLIKESQSDTFKLNILSQMVETINDENIWPRYNRLFYSLASKAADSEKDSTLITHYLRSKAVAINNYAFYVQNYTQSPEKAITFYKQAAEIQKKIGHKKGLVISNNNIANLLYESGKILQALDLFRETLRIQEGLNDSPGLSALLNNIAESYLFICDTTSAEIYLKRALASAIKGGNKAGMAQELQNIGVLANHRGQKKYALICLKKALALRQEIGDVNGVCKSKLNMANILIKEKDFRKVKLYLDEVETYVSKTDNLNIKYLFHSCYGQYLTEINDPKNAELHLEEALKYTRASNSIQDESKVIASLFKLYSTYKNDAKELSLYRRNSEISKILNSSEIRRNAIRKNYEYEYSKKEQDFKIEQALKDEKSRSEKRKQKFITYGISLILILTLIFSVFIFKAFKISKQKNVIISTQKQEVEKQKHFIEEKQKEIVDSINYAKRIQNTLLANDEIITKNLPQHFILFKPKDIVSGDFYWANSVVTENLDLFFIASCDSTGHGVPGAFMSLLNTNFINEAINEKHIYEPNKVFNYVRKRLINSISKESQKDGFDGILVCIDKKNNTITYSAANNTPILISIEKEINKLPCDKMPVGKGERELDFNLYTINFKPGDWLYLYTDGFADQFGGPNGKKYKYKPLNEFLISIHELPPKQQSQKLNQKFEDWKGDLEQVDDVCVVGFQL